MENSACHAHAVPVSGNVSPTAYNHPMLQVQASSKSGCKCGKLRPPRKLHAAVGLWLALFVAVHFSICLTGTNPGNYERTVASVHHSLAGLPGVVPLLIFLPFLLQAGSGLFLAAKEGMQYDVKRCDRGGKLRYFLQRWSGLAMLAFLVLHIGSMYGWGPLLSHWSNSHPMGLAVNGAPDGAAFVYTAAGFHPWSSPAVDSITIAFLFLGTLGTAFHLANGAWSGAILWKLTQSEKGKAIMGYICICAGIVLAAMGTVAWYTFGLSPNVHAALTLSGR